MRISLHSTQEAQLLALSEELKLSPTGLVKLLISQTHSNLFDKGDRPVFEAHLFYDTKTDIR